MYLTDLCEDGLESEISIKVVIVGNGAVGKSSMIQRYCKGIFTQNYKKTIGVDFLEKQLRINGNEVRLMLWDTAGQEEFDAITKSYYRGAQACIIVFSTTDKSSLTSVKKWKKKIEDECGYIPMVLVQNKIDLLHEARISAEEVERCVRDTKLRLYKTSVKEDLNVGSVFYRLAENYINKYKSRPEFRSARRSIGDSVIDPRGHDDMNGKGVFISPITILKKPKKKLSFEYPSYTVYDDGNKDYWSSVLSERTITLRPIGGRHFAPSHYYLTPTNDSPQKQKIFKNSCKIL